jgi:hypothetical protein
MVILKRRKRKKKGYQSLGYNKGRGSTGFRGRILGGEYGV